MLSLWENFRWGLIYFDQFILTFLGLWGIVNNAGFNVMGDVEWLTVNLYQKAMNVNFYGAVRTIRSFLYLIRQSKGTL